MEKTIEEAKAKEIAAKSEHLTSVYDLVIKSEKNYNKFYA